MARRDAVRQVVRRGYWRETDARVIVDAWRRSGEGLATFARRHGVEPRRISRWAGRLGDQERQAVQFHPVRLVDGLDRSRSRRAIEIELDGHRRVHVHPGFDADDLRRVLAVLEEKA